MSQNKPSYGVFMVDIFASSVGIFILVSLLYIIESSKATSNEAMVERFKTLIKRDLIPVDRYSLPVNNDPLHDWGVRARHAREKQEALILLLRDKVLLYHTNQLLSTQQIVDSDIILNYYKKYNKNRRLFIEIHYHDAYHTLKAKIDEALPENVHQWVHWAYNAGNINNPNPVSQQAARPNLDMTPNGRNNDPIDPDQLAMPSSVGGGASSRGNSALTGSPNATGQQNGNQQNDNSGQGQGEGTGQSESDNEGNGEGNSEGENASLGESGQSGDSSPNSQLSQQQQAVQDALTQMHTMQDFIEQLMQPSTQKPSDSTANQPPQPNDSEKTGSQSSGSPTQAGFGSASGGSANSNSSTNNQNPTNGNNSNNQSNQTNGDPQGQGKHTAEQIAKENELAMDIPINEQDEQRQALNLIRKNVFLKVPLHSPISNFNIDIKVPGFTEQNIHLDAVRLKLHQNATADSQTQYISLQHGDSIVPLSAQTNLINPVDNRGWLAVKIVKVTTKEAPKQGWIYGLIDGQGIMLPLFENTVQAQANSDYWYERNNRPLKAFEITESQPKQGSGQ